MKTPPEKIYVNPKAIVHRFYQLAPTPIFNEAYVRESELNIAKRRIEELEQEKREGLLTRREIFPRG